MKIKRFNESVTNKESDWCIELKTIFDQILDSDNKFNYEYGRSYYSPTYDQPKSMWSKFKNNYGRVPIFSDTYYESNSFELEYKGELDSKAMFTLAQFFERLENSSDDITKTMKLDTSGLKMDFIFIKEYSQDGSSEKLDEFFKKANKYKNDVFPNNYPVGNKLTNILQGYPKYITELYEFLTGRKLTNEEFNKIIFSKFTDFEEIVKLKNRSGVEGEFKVNIYASTDYEWRLNIQPIDESLNDFQKIFTKGVENLHVS